MKTIGLLSECPLVRLGIESLFRAEYDLQNVNPLDMNGALLDDLDIVIVVVAELELASHTTEFAAMICGKKPLLLVFESYRSETILPFFQNGVHGCLYRMRDIVELQRAVQDILAGKKYYSQNLANLMLSGFSKLEEKRVLRSVLSKRENEVLERILAGQTNTKIAKDLGISDKTVSSYKARIFEKLELATNADLFKLASRAGWIEAPSN